MAYGVTKTCSCGSGEPRSELYDARGIFCTFICDKCETTKRQKYRPEIFENSCYSADDLGDDEEL